VHLFNRSRSGVELTPAGKAFLRHAEVILGEYANLEADFKHCSSILLKGVRLNGETRNVLVSDGKFFNTNAPQDAAADKVIDASGLAILPALYNTHTHAAMTLLRGYADDMPLQKWLEEYIWPFEEKLTPEDILKGSRMAAGEMLSSGSVFFSDMYFDIEETIKVVDESGLRAAVGITVMENHSKAEEERKADFVKNWKDPTGGRIQLVMAPHAIYTVGEEKLKRCAAFARKHNLRLHIHLSETEREVSDCVREHGMTPVKYLDSIGFLGPDVIAAHCVHVDEKEWKILSRRGVSVSHCPCSNMKLGSGIFPYRLALDSGCRITLGTDGASSNNNLDLREEMKFASLLSKVRGGGDEALISAAEVFGWASRNGAEAFGINAGAIENGKAADAILVDLSNPRLQPDYNLISNFVYSADSSCIAYVLCCGQIVYSSSKVGAASSV